MSELERRLEKARSARTRTELDALLADLEPRGVAERSTRETPASRVESVPEAARDSRPDTGAHPRPASRQLAFAIMGGTRRAGRWVPPTELAAVAIMGGVELDFREAILEPGMVVEINCFTFWGGIEITVPPDVHVDSRGFALMGGFEQGAEIPTDPPRGAPTIRVNGFALMGAVEVKVAERDRRSGTGTRRLERG